MNTPISLQRVGLYLIQQLVQAQAVAQTRTPCTRLDTAEISIIFVPVDEKSVIQHLYLSEEPIAIDEAKERLASLSELVQVALPALLARPSGAVGTFTMRLRFSPEVAPSTEGAA